MIDELLKEFGLTRYQVAKISGISEGTLKKAQDSSLKNLTVKILEALAMATGLTPGKVLDRLLKYQGNSIIRFIEAHPYLNKELVSKFENLMIELNENNIELGTVTFNKYYENFEDTNTNAEIALKNTYETLYNILLELKNNSSKE